VSWITTFTGKQFDFLNPTTSMVCIEDIAHALARLCRFNGHCKTFYCPTPDQRVLTADLRWVPAGDLKEGDFLLGFDEDPVEIGSLGKKRRRFRPSLVTTAVPVKRKVFRLEMEDGSTVCASAEHPWLVATKISRNQAWRTTERLASDVGQGRKRYMHRFVDVWDAPPTWEAGWLAGMFDGEGSLSMLNRSGFQLSIAQKPGPVLDHLRSALAFYNVKASPFVHPASGVTNLQVCGGWRECLRLLGTIRSERLISKFKTALGDNLLGKQMDGVGTPPQIVAAYDEGEQWVSGLETSTRTYFCEGFGAHNSVAEHSIHVADVLAAMGAPVADIQLGLMHDAAEAYVGDVPTPLKRLLPEYANIEKRVQEVIAQRFGLYAQSWESVMEVDHGIFYTEAKVMLDNPPAKPEGLPDISADIEGWGVMESEARYVLAYEQWFK